MSSVMSSPSQTPSAPSRGGTSVSADMTAGSHLSLPASRRGFERKEQKQQRGEKLRGLRVKEQRAPGLRASLTFCLKERPGMEQTQPRDAASDRQLRELAAKWFIETQVPLIVQNGLFPTWFLGFISRKHAEEILRKKEAGCFLIRLSDKAIGYILSYKGGDRCRHFVINQSASGQFIVAGDTAAHDSVSDLISYFRSQPIRPFGEYLTSSCFEALNEELYDVIQVNSEQEPAEQPPSLPPKSSSTLEEVPPLPRRSRQLDGGSEHTSVTYAQLSKHPSRQAVRGRPPGLPPARPARGSEQGLLDCKSRSLTHIDQRSDYEQVYHRSPPPPDTPPRLSPTPPRQAPGRSPPRPEGGRGAGSPGGSLRDVALYHLAGPAAPGQQEALYAEVPGGGAAADHPQDNTYEMIPGLEGGAHRPTEDPRPKHGHMIYRLKNEKWKWWFPEVKKKC